MDDQVCQAHRKPIFVFVLDGSLFLLARQPALCIRRSWRRWRLLVRLKTRRLSLSTKYPKNGTGSAAKGTVLRKGILSLRCC